MNNKNFILKMLIPEFAFSIITILYLISLHKFNKVLYDLGLSKALFKSFNVINYFKLFTYYDNKALKFLAGAIILTIIAICLILSKYSSYKDVDYTENTTDIKFAFIISFIVNIIMIISIFILIINPIVRCLILVLMGSSIGFSNASDKKKFIE
ncbi:MAG: hypothetical protein ACTTIO_05020 [Candidatus Fimenecus sp.]